MRESNPLLKSGLLTPPPLERSSLDPLRYRAHPATVYEHVLLSLDEEQFRAQKPAELTPDQPAQTGVAWIDELERALYGEEK